MAAYAAVVSLMNTVEAIQNHHRLFTSLDKYQTQSLKEKLDSLLQFVEDYDFLGGMIKEAVEDLKSQIGSAAHAAEVVIEGHIVGRITPEHQLDLQKMIEVMCSRIKMFEYYDFFGGISREAVKDLKTLTESAVHTDDVISDNQIIRLRDSTQGITKEEEEDLITRIEVVGSLMEKLDSFLQFADDYNFHADITKEAVEDLMTRIESVAQAAEVVLQSIQVIRGRSRVQERSLVLPKIIEVVASLMEKICWRQIGSKQKSSEEEQSLDLQKIIEGMGSLKKTVNYVKEQMEHEQQSLDLQKIIDDMGSLLEKVNNVKEQIKHEYQKPTDSMPTAASFRSYSASGRTVGFDRYMYQLKDRLTRDRSNRQVIPIIGMGGIGKTTLARNVYDDPLIVQHFDKRAWATVSQEYSVRKILVETLHSLRGSTNGLNGKSEDRLGEELYKILFDVRYLIILDDMWSTAAWEKLQTFFPKQEKGSRIVVTTRHSDMADYFRTFALILSFLDVDKSWQLFCKKVFAHEVCPPELEGIGRKIVKKCGGLPLSIVVIGGVLGKSSRVKYWENVEKNMSSIDSAEKNLCLDILSLSYNHLPTPLKPCFLYLGIYPEDTEIHVTPLVRRWVAEGFLKPNKDQSLEEVGEAYVKDLEDRNLIIVQEVFHFHGKKHKICKVHDLLRELCIRTAEKEKFFCVMSRLDTSRHIDREGRSVFHKICSVFHKIILRDQENDTPQVLSLSVRGETQHQNCELQRVLIDHDFDFRKPTCEQVSLRYWERNVTDERPFQVWNLQTFIDKTTVFFEGSLAANIWEMQQLRHVQFVLIYLPDPPSGNNHDRIVLENLQTLGTVADFKCSEEVCKRMPNIKKLSIAYIGEFFKDEVRCWSTLRLSNVSRFNKLESLKCYFHFTPNRDELLKNLKFPNSLKKLRLSGCKLHWDDLTIIGSLPHLEVLILYSDAVQGPEWNPIENQFLRLKFLNVYISSLINWNADSSHFPRLERLNLSGGDQLEIPEGIGEIPTLELISMNGCSASVAISALKILKLQQEEYGNNDIDVFVNGRKDDEIEVREWMERECISTDNVQLKFF